MQTENDTIVLMKGLTEKIKILRFEQDAPEDFEDLVLSEKSFTLFLNGNPAAKFICVNSGIKELTAGHLLCEGRISSIKELKSVLIDDESGHVYAETIKTKSAAGAKKGVASIDIPPAPVSVNYAAIVSALKEFQEMSPLFKETGCMHSAALLNNEYVFRYFAEDIGRYNAVEKVIGKAFLDGFNLPGAMLVASSRMPLELIQIAYRAGINAVISVSAPTLEGIRFARENKIILIGMFRGNRINIYAH